MERYQKETLLQSLGVMEKHIAETKETIATYAADPLFSTSACEALSTYTARLSGLLQKRQGFCYSLSILGYRIMWDGEHAVDIVEVK